MRRKHVRVSMLQRQIQVVAYLGMSRHRFAQPGRYLLGIGIHDAQPVEIGRGIQYLLDQVWQGVFESQVAAVGGGVLGNEDDLAGAGIDQMACFLGDVRHGPAVGGTLDGRNGAERTGRTAPVGDLQIGARALERALRFRLAAGQRRVTQEHRRRRVPIAPASQPADQVVDLLPAPGADDAIDSRHGLHQPFTPALRQTAGRHQQLVAAFALAQFA